MTMGYSPVRPWQKTSRLIDEIKTLPGVIPEGIVSFKSAIDVPEGVLSPEDVSRIAGAVHGILLSYWSGHLAGQKGPRLCRDF